MRRFLRIRGASGLAAICAVVLTACAPSPESGPTAPAAVLGFLVGSAGDCDATPAGIEGQAEELVRRGLRDAGYTRLFVVCDREVRSVDDAGVRKRLEGAGLTVERVRLDDPRVAQVMPGGARPSVLRSVISRRVMLAQSLVFSGTVAELPTESLSVLTNREVIALAVDGQRQPGAPVGGDPNIYSRAIGDRGLLVSLSSRGGSAGPVSVPIAELNLAGDDSVPATDVWTGRRIHSVDGRFTVDLATGDTALLRVG